MNAGQLHVAKLRTIAAMVRLVRGGERPSVAGISGGRTSGEMDYWLPPSTVRSFQNTGREAAGTYDFIERLEQDTQRPIIRLEFRAPPRGDEPRKATFEVVEHRYLARRGEPFRDLLECLKAYRAKHKDLGPVAPWARHRICTAYLKIRTQRKYCAALGWGGPRDYIEFVGLRADEPARVAKMNERNAKLGTWEQAPLADAGVVKEDILRAWSRRPFDLTVPECMGNCTGCFLKDEKDLATALLEPETDPEWWIAIERDFAPMRRGRPSYAQVYAEAPARMMLRIALGLGTKIDIEASAKALRLEPRRVKLIIAQEQVDAQPFSCECDAAKAEDVDDYEAA